MVIRQPNHDKPIVFQILLHYQLRKRTNIEYTSVYYQCTITDIELDVTSDDIKTIKMQHTNSKNICKLHLS